MPMHPFPGDPNAGDTKQYFVVCFDGAAAEQDDPDGVAPGGGAPRAGSGSRRAGRRLLSLRIAEELERARQQGAPYSDVFLLCHGWLADLPGACSSYDAWIRVVQQTQPQAAATRIPTGYRPLVVAVHWPSLPSTVWRRRDGMPMPFESESHTPGAAAGGTRKRPGLLAFASAIVPTFSFYAMKQLAGRTGRRGVAPMLAQLQRVAGNGTRFHLMGHSFGAKLVAETLADRDQHRVRAVESMFLIEGALSTWAFAPSNPYRDPVGAAAPVFSHAMVHGVAVSSTSRWDWALGRMFPAAQVLDTIVKRVRHVQVPFARLHRPGFPPRLAALGIDAFSGVPGELHATLLPAAAGGLTTTYGFTPGKRYQLVTDDVVNTVNTNPGGPNPNDRPFVGAHSNIAHPELATAYWEAVFPGPVRAVTPPAVQQTVQA